MRAFVRIHIHPGLWHARGHPEFATWIARACNIASVPTTTRFAACLVGDDKFDQQLYEPSIVYEIAFCNQWRVGPEKYVQNIVHQRASANFEWYEPAGRPEHAFPTIQKALCTIATTHRRRQRVRK